MRARVTVVVWLTLCLAGCAGFHPRPVDEVPFLERAQSQQDEQLTVTVAVPLEVTWRSHRTWAPKTNRRVDADAFGYTAGVGRSTPEDPGRNLTGDPYFTDGLRAVMILSEETVDYEDIRLLEWERAFEHRDRSE